MKPALKDKIEFVDIETATTPRNGVFRVIVGAWWAVIDEKVMFYLGHAPQCNHSREIAERVNRKLYPECEIRQLPAVYVPWKD